MEVGGVEDKHREQSWMVDDNRIMVNSEVRLHPEREDFHLYKVGECLSVLNMGRCGA